MSTTDWRDEIGQPLLMIRVIVFGLTSGSLMFMVIAVYLVQISQVPAAGAAPGPIMTHMALGFAAMAVVLRMVVPKVIESVSMKRIAEGTWRGQMPPTGQLKAQNTQLAERLGDAGKVLSVLATRTVIGGAILEGSTFFSLIAYEIVQSPLALAAAIVTLIGVALHFPTRAGTIRWIEKQLAAIEQIRQFG